eukprot:11068395-Lingulodinium_polyedra.AAC.1
MDVHRSTVVRFEIDLRAALLAGSHHFHNVHQGRLEEGLGQDDGCRYEVHGMRGDATNSQVRQRSKLRLAFLETVYVVESVKATDSWSDVIAQAARWRCMADVQVVGASTGAVCHALVPKQA